MLVSDVTCWEVTSHGGKWLNSPMIHWWVISRDLRQSSHSSVMTSPHGKHQGSKFDEKRLTVGILTNCIVEQTCEQIVGFQLKAQSFAKNYDVYGILKIWDIVPSSIFLKSLKIAQIQDGRQYLYNKKTNHAYFYISQRRKKLVYHIIRCIRKGVYIISPVNIDVELRVQWTQWNHFF